MSQQIASGHGLATLSLSGAVLDTWFPEPALGNLSAPVLPFLSALAGVDEIRGVKREVVSLEIDLNKAPESVSDAYLRLHLLSHRVIKPHGANLDGIFGILNNVVWTSVGPCPVENFEITRANLKQKFGQRCAEMQCLHCNWFKNCGWKYSHGAQHPLRLCFWIHFQHCYAHAPFCAKHVSIRDADVARVGLQFNRLVYFRIGHYRVRNHHFRHELHPRF